MDKIDLLSITVVAWLLDVNKDPFRPREKDEELLCPEVLYLR